MIFILIRVMIGVLFIVSGLEKVLSPYQNFLYIVQAYYAFPSLIEILIAQIFPWIELIVGIFVFLGLFLSWAVRIQAVMFMGFIILISQALFRQLPLEECGCFGQLIHIPPQGTLVIDTICLILLMVLIKNFHQTKKFSLDHFFK